MQIVNLMMIAATKPLILQRSEYEYANVALFLESDGKLENKLI